MAEPTAVQHHSIKTMPNLIEGRIVHFVLPDGKHRPAMVVFVYRDDPQLAKAGVCNLQVFTNGPSDLNEINTTLIGGIALGISWVNLTPYNAENKPLTWHWVDNV